MRTLLFSAMLLALATQSANTDTKADPKPVTVPFELLKSGHMAVQVKVNGEGPFLLIFDTGAPTSLLTNRLAKDAKLGKAKNASRMPGFGSIGEAKIKSLQVGDQVVEDVSAIVMDHPTVEALGRALGKRLDGIVGFPFFARFKMTIDYEKRTLTLVPSGYKPTDSMEAMSAMMLQGPGRKVLAPAAQWGVAAAKAAGDDAEGIEVKAVVPGSAAEKAGLKAGDRMLTLDGRWTDTMQDLYEAATHVPAGKAVPVRLKRDGKEIEVMVTPASGM